MDGDTSALYKDLELCKRSLFAGYDLWRIVLSATYLRMLEGDSQGLVTIVREWEEDLRSKALKDCGEDDRDGTRWNLSAQDAYMLMLKGQFREGYEAFTRSERPAYRGFSAMHCVGYMFECLCNLEIGTLVIIALFFLSFFPFDSNLFRAKHFYLRISPL